MRLRIFIILTICGCLFEPGCREPFEVNVPAGNSLLVVSGMITDQPGPYTIKLSRSNQLQSTEFPAETGAAVILESRSGQSEVLVEEEEGLYRTSANGIQGQVGEEYRIRIQTTGELLYESSWELLKQSPPIDNLYFEYEERDTEDGTLQGLQTYLDTQEPDNSIGYFRYEWIETWTYHADLPAQFTYLGNDNRVSFPPKKTCWIDEPSTAISIATSMQNVNGIVSRHPILYVSTETIRLRFKYSLLVKQYALDQEEFIFWEGIQETALSSGSLFDKQPQSIVGNLYRVDGDEPVLGYFSASSVSEKRIFMVRADLPENTFVNQTLSDLCFDGQIFVEKSPTSEEEIFELLDKGAVFFDWVVVPGQGIVGYIFTTPICSDCTVQGGSTEKPDYWPDN